YLGLVGLSNLMHSHPHVISDHQHVILECLSVEDTTIRLRALELLVGMVNPDNASGIIEELMRHTVVADGVYRQDLMAKILLVCSVQKYQNVTDFDWYLGILVQLATVPGENAKNAAEITRQLVDLAVRVKGIRAMLVQKMIEFLLDEDAVTGPGAKTTCQVLYAAGWIIGEFILEYVEDEDDDDDDDGRLDDVMNAADHMLLPRTTSLPVAPVQAVYMQALLKLLMVMVDKADEATVDSLAQMIVERLPAFVQSEHIEVQERACGVQEIVLGLGLGLNALSADDRANRVFDSQPADTRVEVLTSFFAEPLAPVGAKAQGKPDNGSSDDSRRRSTKKKAAQYDDLSQVDLTTPLGDDEVIPDSHWHHRQVDEAKDKSKKKKKSKTMEVEVVEKKKKKKKEAVLSAEEPAAKAKKTKKDGQKKKKPKKQQPNDDDQVLLLDRFIPSRGAMNADLCQYMLAPDATAPHPPSKGHGPTHRDLLFATLVASDDRRMLRFQSRPLSPPSIALSACIPRVGGAATSLRRHIPLIPTRILDAPNLRDDYYLNLLAWSNSNLLAIALDTVVYVYNVDSGGVTAVRAIQGGREYVTSVCGLVWSPIQKELLSSHGYSQNELCLWAYPRMNRIKEFTGHTARVLHMALSPDGASVVSAAADETLRFWSVFGPPSASTRPPRFHLTSSLCGVR
ncbi:hypothetical protein DYB36_009443, partial [Aphanomyces astaci]